MNTLKNILKRIAVSICMMALLSNNVSAGTWWIDTNADTDPNTCVEDEAVNDDDCTLRDAVSQLSTGDTIRFLESIAIVMGGFGTLTIDDASTTVDGQTDGYTVELDGNGGIFSAFTIDGVTGVTIKGLKIYNAFDNYIKLNAYSDNTTIENNYLGLKPDGTAGSFQPTNNGVRFQGTSNNVTITGNTISNSGSGGLNANSINSGITITNNKIGTNPAGTAARPNTFGGVYVYSSGGATISDNVISGNTTYALYLNSFAGTNTVSNNKIGVDSTGNTALANTYDGITIAGNSSGTTTISGNTISGNSRDGIRYETSGTLGATWKIKNNKIGTNAAGTAAVANTGKGINAQSNSSNTATYVIGTDGDGTSDSTEGNTIAGNNGGGIVIYDGTAVTVAGNKIGTNAAGDTAIANGSSAGIDAVFVDQPNTITIGTNGDGTSDADEANVIAAGTQYGIHVTGGGADTSSTLTIAGNAVGSKADGSGGATFLNQAGAIEVNHNDLATVNIGTVPATPANGRNIIPITCGGIRVRGVENGGSAATVNIKNNYIGVQSDGTTAANPALTCATGTWTDGIIAALDAGTIGTLTIGTDAATPDANEGNIIANGPSTFDGIEVGAGIQTAKIAGNKIGVNSSGADAGNSASGIEVNTSSSALSGVTIGGSNAAERNVIGSNADAINVVDAGSTPATIGIINNYLGFGTDGSTARGNDSGAQVKIADGGALTITDNVIGNSNTTAVQITGGTGLTFTGNKVGTTSVGTAAAGNNSYGLHLNASTITSATIGGITTALANVIAASLSHGIYVQDLAAGTTAVSIKGNYIGVCANPSTPSISSSNLVACRNGGDGINAVEGAFTIGGDNSLGDAGTGALGEGNVISNNVGEGIDLSSSVSTTSILGNVVGLIRADGGIFDTAAGNGSAGDARSGILVAGSSITAITVGGVGSTTASSKRNVISSNNNHGVELLATNSSFTSTIQNNYIGTDWTGVSDLGNASDAINQAYYNVNIGGTGSNQGNVISGNGGDGIDLNGSVATANIYANVIGLNAAGTAAIANASDGIELSSSSATVNVGNSASSGRNVISGNGANGINVTAGSLTVRGNYVGLGSDSSTVIGNTTRSIKATSTGGSVSSLTVGGTTSGQENKISNTGYIGFRADDVTPTNESTMTTGNNWTTTSGSFGELASPFYYWARYVSSAFTAYGPTQCSDGLDNDGDGKTDYPVDPSCSNALDNDETNPVQCSDGVDNDGDSVVDLADGGCESSSDTSETGSGGGSAVVVISSGLTAQNNSQNSNISNSNDVKQVEEENLDDEQEDIDNQVVVEKANSDLGNADKTDGDGGSSEVSVVPEAVAHQKLQQSVSSVLDQLLDNPHIDDMEVLLEAYEERHEEASEVVDLKDRDVEQVVLDDYLTDLSSGESVNFREARKVIEETLGNALQDEILKLQSDNEAGTILMNIRDEEREITAGTDLVFEPDSEKAAKLQEDFDKRGFDRLVITLFDDINHNDVADVIEINENVFELEQLPVSVNDVVFHGGSLSKIHEYKNIEDILPAHPRITNLGDDVLRVGKQMVLWVGGREVGQEFDIFVLDPEEKVEDSVLPKSYHMGTGIIDEVNRAAFLLDFEDSSSGLSLDGTEKELYVVIEDDENVGELYRVLLDPKTEDISDMVLKNRAQKESAAYFMMMVGGGVIFDGLDIDQDEVEAIANKSFSGADPTGGRTTGSTLLSGTARPGEKVNITWKSIVRTSVVLADAKGTFEVEVPEGMEKGSHEVIGYVYNKSSAGNFLSNISRLLFSK